MLHYKHSMSTRNNTCRSSFRQQISSALLSISSWVKKILQCCNLVNILCWYPTFATEVVYFLYILYKWNRTITISSRILYSRVLVKSDHFHFLSVVRSLMCEPLVKSSFHWLYTLCTLLEERYMYTENINFMYIVNLLANIFCF